MDSMLCPHGCGVTFTRNGAFLNRYTIYQSTVETQSTVSFRCPGCRGIVLELWVEEYPMAEHEESPSRPPTETHHLIWPRRGRTAAPEVPEPLRGDFAEAAAILDLSPQASAGLARRVLQHVLVDHLGAPGRDLEKQIDSVIDDLPSYVSDSLHALRNVGNFGAHPIKDTQTGAVVPVEPGEAEWTLDTVELLFDHVFVAPKRAAARRAALNGKLAVTGKPQLGSDGKPIKSATP